MKRYGSTAVAALILSTALLAAYGCATQAAAAEAQVTYYYLPG